MFYGAADFVLVLCLRGARGGAVGWVIALQAGRSLEFFFDIIIGRTMALGVESSSNRNEYQEYFLEGKSGRWLGLITLPPSCVDCLEIWEPQTPGTLRACPGLYRDCLTLEMVGWYEISGALLTQHVQLHGAPFSVSHCPMCTVTSGLDLGSAYYRVTIKEIDTFNVK
jgi:hypothetical protein